MLSNGDRGINRIRTGRRPIIVLGDSDAAGGYLHIENCDASVRLFQSGQEWYGNFYCHQGEGNPTAWAYPKGPLGPFLAYGQILRGSWCLDLGIGLTAHNVPATILNYAVGSTTFDDYSPTITPTNYALRLTWLQNRLRAMPAHLDPIVVLDFGLTGPGTPTWTDGMTTLMAALRTDLGFPNMGVVVIRAPYTCGAHDNYYGATIALQNAYVASDPHSRIAYNDTMTYVDDNTLAQGLANGVHFDSAGGRKLAIGPDDGSTSSIVTALLQLGI